MTDPAHDEVPERRNRNTLLFQVSAALCFLPILFIVVYTYRQPARREARRVKNALQMSQLHRELVFYSDNNNGFFPGRTSTGANMQGWLPSPRRGRWPDQYGATTPSGVDQSIALAVLLNGTLQGNVRPESLISPFEKASIGGSSTTPSGQIEIAPAPSTQFTISPRNCSYAFLRWADAPNPSATRRDEWSNSGNGNAPVIADRCSSIADNIRTTSVHVSTPSSSSPDWEGHITWNDNSTRFESSGLIDGDKLKIGNMRGTIGTADDVFDGAAVGNLTEAANVWFSYNK